MAPWARWPRLNGGRCFGLSAALASSLCKCLSAISVVGQGASHSGSALSSACPQEANVTKNGSYVKGISTVSLKKKCLIFKQTPSHYTQDLIVDFKLTNYTHFIYIMKFFVAILARVRLGPTRAGGQDDGS